MARIEGVSRHNARWTTRFAYWFGRRRVGRVPEPLRIVAHHPWIERAAGAFELALDRSRRVDARLKGLAEIKAAALIGCPF